MAPRRRALFYRVTLIFALTLLCLAGVKYPIHERLDLSKHEGEKVQLYLVEIVGNDKDAYVVETGLSRERALVVSVASFEKGEVVSFYGEVQDGRLVAEKYHLHTRPNLSYYLSLIGFLLFLYAFFREWVFDPKARCLVWRMESA